MRENFLVFGQPDIQEDEIQEVVDSLKACWLGTGPKVTRFEQDFAAYKGVDAAAAVHSCTAALHLALLAAGLKPGDEVITTPLTFVASVNAIIHAGATPVLADVDPTTMNLDPKKVEEKITARTRAILPVHFAGRSCAMDDFLALAKQHDLVMIEDCAHAVETEYHGQKAGTLGDYGCFSFYATKNVATGEGGMVLAKNREHLDRIKRLALHGLSQDAWKRFSDEGYKHYQAVELGFKYNMMDLQAAIGIHQLARVEENYKKREKIWALYMKELEGLPLTLPAPVEKDTRHGLHLFTILVDETKTNISRDQLLNHLNKNKIGAGVHYLAVPEHPYYQTTFGWDPADTPEATRIGRTTLSLPLSPKITHNDVMDVAVALRSSFSLRS